MMDDYTRYALDPRNRAMLDFAMQLTLRPREMRATDVGRLREVGFDDDAVHDIVQVTALFNYYNRLADGLGIDPEPEWGDDESAIGPGHQRATGEGDRQAES